MLYFFLFLSYDQINLKYIWGQKIIKTENGKSILWHFIEKLYKLQRNEGLRIANKLTKKYIHYENNKMNVKLAIQTFSESVYNFFQFLLSLGDKEILTTFKNCLETALFCLYFNKNIWVICLIAKIDVPNVNLTFHYMMKIILR